MNKDRDEEGEVTIGIGFFVSVVCVKFIFGGLFCNILENVFHS